MCGIVGYIGSRNATDILIKGLESLEYRGYDSAGIAVCADKKIEIYKEKGRIENLKQAIKNNFPKGNAGIGHTRWATHGEPSRINSHPHQNRLGDIAVVHNGIIENHEEIKAFLQKEGYTFVSQTDTEVIPHLIDFYYKDDLLFAVKKAVSHLRGSYALGVMSERETGKIIAVRKDSPLIVGIGNGENFIASDIPAILCETRDIYFLDDNEFVVLSRDGVSITDEDGKPVKKAVYKVDFSAETAQKGGYEHFMLKEIYEQPTAIANTLSENFENMEFFENAERIFIVACGTAYHAGLIGKRCMEELCGMPCEVDLASEFRYRKPLITEKTPLIVVSQSGETADTLAALRLAKQKNAKVLAITNVVGSTISREADFVFYTHAGPEIAVASTKAFTSQLTAFYMLAQKLAESRNTTDKEIIDNFKKELKLLPDIAKEVLNLDGQMQSLAKRIKNHTDLFYLGRGLDYAVAQEASLKLKEIAYIHSEGYAAGELKHGPIALVEDGTAVIAISTDPDISEKTASNLKEVIARGAFTVSVGENLGQTDISIQIPKVNKLLSPIAAIIPLQLLAYHTSVKRGYDVDKPRNLAKSVTVE